MAESMCDRCYNPGQCCSGFFIGIGQDCKTKNGASRALRRYNVSNKVIADFHPLPFRPLHRVESEEQGPWWLWECPKLGEDGRCTIYEDRPVACRDFEPTSSGLCVHFKGAESLGNEYFGENIYSDTVMKWGQ